MKDKSQKESIRERRTVRRNQRDLMDQINRNKAELSDVHSDVFRRIHNQLDSISDGVTHTRELQNDANVLYELTYAVRKQASSMNDYSARFDFNELVSATKARYGHRSDRRFAWQRLGPEAMSIFTGPMSIRPMLGSLGKEIPTRTTHPRAPRVGGDADDNLPDVVHTEGDVDEDLEATNNRIHTLLHHIKTESDEGIDLLRVLIDPVSIIQSVENMFDLGFLIKNKKIAQEYNEETQELVALPIEDVDVNDVPGRQQVVRVDIKDLRRLRAIMWPEYNELAAEYSPSTQHDEPIASQSSGQSSAAKSTSKSTTTSVNHPLHRVDEIYLARDVESQIKLIAQRKEDAKRKNLEKKRGVAGTQSTPEDGSSQLSDDDADSGLGTKRNGKHIHGDKKRLRTTSSTAANNKSNASGQRESRKHHGAVSSQENESDNTQNTSQKLRLHNGNVQSPLTSSIDEMQCEQKKRRGRLPSRRADASQQGKENLVEVL